MNKLSRIIQLFCAMLVIVVVLVGCYNSIARYIDKVWLTHLSSNAYIELQWYLFSAIFLFGASSALVDEKHIRVDVWYQRFSEKKKARVNVLGTVLFLIPFCSVLLYHSSLYFYKSWLIRETSADPNGLYPFIAKAFIPIGFLLLLIQGVWYLVKHLRLVRSL